MKSLITIFVIFLFYGNLFGQDKTPIVMTVEGIKPEHICVENTVYFILSQDAKPVESKDSIYKRLNNSIQYLKEHPKYKRKIAILHAVNCKGEFGGGIHILKPSNKELEDQLIAFFNKINEWIPGKVDGKEVDSWYMWDLVIKKGVIYEEK